MTGAAFALLQDLQTQAQSFAWAKTGPLEPPSSYRQAIACEVLGQSYWFDLREVVEVLRFPKLTYLPGAPAWVQGIMHLRGTLVPVLDLAALMSGRSTGSGRAYVLVVKYQGYIWGMALECILGIEASGGPLLDLASLFASPPCSLFFPVETMA